jgi:hypothetical protein
MGNTSIHFVSTENWDLSQFPVAEIKVATENDLLYERFASANEDDQRLMGSTFQGQDQSKTVKVWRLRDVRDWAKQMQEAQG